MVGFLNSHPDIFVGYEMRIPTARPSKYAIKFLAKYPETRKFFHYDADYASAYRKLADWLAARGFSYKFFGDKSPNLDPPGLAAIAAHPVLFMVRDIRSWLAKDGVIQIYQSKHDVTPCAIAYTDILMRSHLLPNVLHVGMSEFFSDLARVKHKIADWLGADLAGFRDDWWASVGNYALDDPKSALNWWKGHPSSTMAPAVEDTRFELRSPCPLGPVFDLFDKYVEGRRFGSREVNDDLAQLHCLRDIVAPLDSCFRAISRSRIAQPRVKANFLRRLLGSGSVLRVR